MKNIILSCLLFFTGIINAYSIEELEQKITASNFEMVQEMLANIEFSQKDYKRLLILSEDILKLRKNEGLSAILDLSFKKLSVIGISLLVVGATVYAKAKANDSIRKSIFTDNKKINFSNIEKADLIFRRSFIARCLGFVSIISTIIKQFYDNKMLHKKAILIKQLIYKASLA